MLEFDKNKNILYAYQNEAARPPLILEEQKSPVYESYQEYCKTGVIDDAIGTMLPALKAAIKINYANQLNITKDGVRVVERYIKIVDSRFDAVQVKFHMHNTDYEKAEYVTIMELPRVLPDGTILHNNKEYAFIHMIEQEPVISFEMNETNKKSAAIKIKNGPRSILIEDSRNVLNVSLSDLRGSSSMKRYSIIHVIAALAENEGYDKYAILKEYKNFTLANLFRDEKQAEFAMEWFGGNNNSVNAIEYKSQICERLTLNHIKYDGSLDTSYDNTEVRTELNNILSLDRAVGEVLALDVYSNLNKERLLATAGTVVDSNLVEVFQSEGVYNIFIKHIPNVEGYYLATDILVNCAPAGLKITPDIRKYFPNESGMYTSHFYEHLDNPIMLSSGTPLTRNIINILSTFGENEIKVSDKKNLSEIKTLYFYEEVLSNRQFLGKYIGKDPDKWYYLNKDNEFVENGGSYTTYDFVALQSFAVKLFEGKWIERITNSDIGFRKRLIPLAEQYRRAFAYAVREGFKQMSRKFKTIYNKGDTRYNFLEADKINNEFYPFHKAFWNFLVNEAKCIIPLAEDNITNPIAYQSARTKINVYTANKHSVSDSQRGIAIGSYGKIDPFEIPQSGKLGTVYNSTVSLKITPDGRMMTPYYRVITTPDGSKTRILFDQIEYMTAKDEESSDGYVFADLCSLEFDKDGWVKDNTKNVLCRVPSISTVEKQTFANRDIRYITHVNVDTNQILSWAGSTIPFVSSNDAARAIFAVAQEKQAKGLVNAEEPDVMTSAYEQFAWLNDKYGVIAKHDCVIDAVNYDKGKNKISISVKYDYQTKEDEGTIYELDEFFASKYSVTKLKVLVKAGDRVKKGQMIVSSNFISDRGILQFGINALGGFICDGQNYEDGTHKNESLGNRLASYKLHKEDVTKNPEHTKRFVISGYKNTKYHSPENKDTVKVTYTDNRDLVRASGDILLKHSEGFFENWNFIKSDKTKWNYGAEVQTISVDRSNEGDKSSNRHGNKGVLSKVEPCAYMPRLKNGMPLEICFNPLGVGSRMNIGQVKEIHCGLIAHVNKLKISTDAFNSISNEEISTLMSMTVDLMDSIGDDELNSVISNYKGLVPDELLEHCRRNIKHIRVYRGCFNKRGTTKLMLPTNDGRMTETEVLIGYIYIFKLIQESASKVHARGGEINDEPYGEVTDAPTEGQSRNGGQRFGTMEINALSAYGTSAYISEIVNERCDNGIARNNLYAETYLPDNVKKKYKINKRGQRRSVTEFLYKMLALGIMAQPDEDEELQEFYPLSSSNAEDFARWKPSVLRYAKGNKPYKKKDNASSEDDVIEEIIAGSEELSATTEPIQNTDSVRESILKGGMFKLK